MEVFYIISQPIANNKGLFKFEKYKEQNGSG